MLNVELYNVLLAIQSWATLEGYLSYLWTDGVSNAVAFNRDSDDAGGQRTRRKVRVVKASEEDALLNGNKSEYLASYSFVLFTSSFRITQRQPCEPVKQFPDEITS